jgi:MFS family permease
MAAGYVLIGTGFALNAVARSVPAFALAMTIFTLGEMIAMPVSQAYIADLSPPHLRGRYMGVFGFTWALALVCGPALGMIVYLRSPLLLWLGCGRADATYARSENVILPLRFACRMPGWQPQPDPIRRRTSGLAAMSSGIASPFWALQPKQRI